MIDINYHIKNIGKKTESYINVEGALDDNSKKNFKIQEQIVLMFSF